MKTRERPKTTELDAAIEPFREALDGPVPPEGWVRAIREALGMTNLQLASRLGGRAAQTVEAMQKNEVSGAISLRTLRALAEAMECRLIYAVVPKKSLAKVRRDKARVIAARLLGDAVRPVGTEDREARESSEQAALDALVQQLLAGPRKKLWE